jgi:hypothetical protein
MPPVPAGVRTTRPPVAVPGQRLPVATLAVVTDWEPSRVHRDAQRQRGLPFAQTVVVPQHDAGAFACGQPAQRSSQVHCAGGVRGLGPFTVTHAPQPPAPALADQPLGSLGGEIGQDSAHVRQRPVGRRDPVPVLPSLGQRLGGDVVSRVVLTGQQVRKAGQPAVVLGEERVEGGAAAVRRLDCRTVIRCTHAGTVAGPDDAGIARPARQLAVRRRAFTNPTATFSAPARTGRGLDGAAQAPGA